MNALVKLPRVLEMVMEQKTAMVKLPHAPGMSRASENVRGMEARRWIRTRHGDECFPRLKG